VRKSGKQVRITAQLIDAEHDRHLWSETYDRELTDIFKIQDEIANAIVAAMRGSLGAGNAERVVTVKADTDNLDAYQLYLKARELFVTRADVGESIRLSEQVVRMDPKFARAWENLAAAYAVAPSWLPKDRDFAAPAREAATRALELDPSLSTPWAAMAMSDQYGRHADWGRDLELIDKALAADPKNATAYLWRATFWMNLGILRPRARGYRPVPQVRSGLPQLHALEGAGAAAAGQGRRGHGALRARRRRRLRAQSRRQLRAGAGAARRPHRGAPAARAPRGEAGAGRDLHRRTWPARARRIPTRRRCCSATCRESSAASRCSSDAPRPTSGSAPLTWKCGIPTTTPTSSWRGSASRPRSGARPRSSARSRISA
jgi:hypothetical protein